MVYNQSVSHISLILPTDLMLPTNMLRSTAAITPNIARRNWTLKRRRHVTLMMVVTMTFVVALIMMMLLAVLVLSSLYTTHVSLPLSFFKVLAPYFESAAAAAAADNIGHFNSGSSLQLSNQVEFQKTLKECTSNDLQKCKQYLPAVQVLPNNHNHNIQEEAGGTAHPRLQRVAFMSTGGKTAKKMYDILKEAIRIYYSHNYGDNHVEQDVMTQQQQQQQQQHMDWNWMTHVPALGYGKSHGWTKIVRFVHLSLVEETLEALQIMVEDHVNDDGSLKRRSTA
jgi:hypothetical protein